MSLLFRIYEISDSICGSRSYVVYDEDFKRFPHALHTNYCSLLLQARNRKSNFMVLIEVNVKNSHVCVRPDYVIYYSQSLIYATIQNEDLIHTQWDICYLLSTEKLHYN